LVIVIAYSTATSYIVNTYIESKNSKTKQNKVEATAALEKQYKDLV